MVTFDVKLSARQCFQVFDKLSARQVFKEDIHHVNSKVNYSYIWLKKLLQMQIIICLVNQ